MDKPLVQNANDESQVKAAVKKVKDETRLLEEAVFGVSSTADGKRLIWHLLGKFRLNQSVMVPGDAYMTAHNSGKQDAGHYRLGLVIAARPQAWLEMQKEAGELKNG